MYEPPMKEIPFYQSSLCTIISIILECCSTPGRELHVSAAGFPSRVHCIPPAELGIDCRNTECFPNRKSLFEEGITAVIRRLAYANVPTLLLGRPCNCVLVYSVTIAIKLPRASAPSESRQHLGDQHRLRWSGVPLNNLDYTQVTPDRAVGCGNVVSYNQHREPSDPRAARSVVSSRNMAVSYADIISFVQLAGWGL